MLVGIIIAILVGVQLIIILPRYFIKSNNRKAAQASFDSFVKELSKYDKQYGAYGRQLTKTLNVINYWLRTGNDPAELDLNIESDELRDKERVAAMEDNIVVKEKRNAEFDVYGLEENEFGQESATFHYSHDYIECIYYCITPEALEKKYYRNVIYCTTSKPTNIPMVYPYKYDGAQMISLYKHPSQAMWFVKNWKKIREELEAVSEEPDLEMDAALDDFNL